MAYVDLSKKNRQRSDGARPPEKKVLERAPLDAIVCLAMVIL
jgi:hypothetical protein